MDDDNAKKRISRKELGTIIGISWQKHKYMRKKYVASLLDVYESTRTLHRYLFPTQTGVTTEQKPGSGGHNHKKNYLKKLTVRQLIDQKLVNGNAPAKLGAF